MTHLKTARRQLFYPWSLVVGVYKNPSMGFTVYGSNVSRESKTCVARAAQNAISASSGGRGPLPARGTGDPLPLESRATDESHLPLTNERESR